MALGLVLMAWLVIGFNSRIADLRRLSAQQQIINGEYAGRLSTRSVLQTAIVYATSAQAVDRWAREDQHMILSGDNPVNPLAAKAATATPLPTPVVTTTPQNNWDSWKALFLGPQSP